MGLALAAIGNTPTFPLPFPLMPLRACVYRLRRHTLYGPAGTSICSVPMAPYRLILSLSLSYSVPLGGTGVSVAHHCQFVNYIESGSYYVWLYRLAPMALYVHERMFNVIRA